MAVIALRVYLSVPMIANRSLPRALLMAKAIRDSGHTVSSPWVLGPLEKSQPSVVDIFERDRTGAEESDAIVADVSEPSTGVGMEIMAAYKARRRVIVVARRGSVKSAMLLHMKEKELVEYGDEQEIYPLLCEKLQSPGEPD